MDDAAIDAAIEAKVRALLKEIRLNDLYVVVQGNVQRAHELYRLAEEVEKFIPPLD